MIPIPYMMAISVWKTAIFSVEGGYDLGFAYAPVYSFSFSGGFHRSKRRAW